MPDDQNISYILDTNYVPLTPQSYRKSQSVYFGMDNQDTRAIKRMSNTLVNGQSSDTPLGDTTYSVNLMQDVVSERQQSGSLGFASKNDRPFVLDSSLETGAPLLTKEDQLKFLDKNPAKAIEQDAGDVNQFVYMKGAVDKDSPVYFNLKTPMRDKDYYNPNQTVGHNSWFAKHQTDWGFKAPTIEVDKDKTERITKAQSLPYCRIIEDRVGTAAYGYGEEMKGAFTEDVVMIEILQNLSGFRISGSRQEFTPVEPRGSQRPLYFYNKNSGRTVEFTANFHQQEYPLEPLYSIAEKAQYLLRPYRHGDYGLIPKTVRVEVPGRIFRCYCTGAEASFDGEDYRGWSELGLNESNIGTFGNEYTGRLRVEQQTNRIYNSDPYSVNVARDVLSGSYFTSKDYRYGLSSMTISFQFNILEEVKLTTYETQAEVVLREEQSKEEQRKNDQEAAIQKAQAYIDEAKKNGIQIDYTAEQLVTVDKNGDVVAILIDANGEITPVSDSNTLTIEEFNKQKVLESANKAAPKAATDVAQPLPTVAVLPATQDSMLAYLVEAEAKERPGDSRKDIEEELRNQYKDDPTALYGAYVACVQEISTSGKQSDPESLIQAKFMNYSQSIDITFVNGEVQDIKSALSIPEQLKNLFAIPLDKPSDFETFGNILMKAAEDDIKYYIYFEESDDYEDGDVDESITEGSFELWKEPFKASRGKILENDGFSLFTKSHVPGAISIASDFENVSFHFDDMLKNNKINKYQYGQLLKIWGFKDDENRPWVEVKQVCDPKNKNNFNMKDEHGENDIRVTEFILKIFKNYRTLFYERIVEVITDLEKRAKEEAKKDVPEDKKWMLDFINKRALKCYSNEKSMKDAIKADTKWVTGNWLDLLGDKVPDIPGHYKSFEYNYAYYKIS